MRRFVVTLSGLVVVVVGLLAATPAAFAMRFRAEGGGGSSVTPAPVIHHSGLGVWPISLIVVAGVFVLVLSVSAFVRTSHRSTPVPS